MEAEESPFRATVLAGRVALITGGGSGIGLEIARQFGRHGARLALMGRREAVLEAAAELLRADGTEAIWVQGDVRSKDDAARSVERAVAAFGRLDILVNGAAGNFLASAEDLSPNGFRTVLDIDTVGTFTMSVAARPYLSRGAPGREAEPDGGLIINISATLQYTAAWYQVHLVAAKAAIDSLTRSLALEWGTDYGIRANIIAPGPIGNTPGMDKLAPSEVGIEPSHYIPLGRMGESWDIAMAALYLASPAGKWVSGAVMVVDGAGWLYRPRLVSKEVLRTLGRTVEQRSRERPRILSERGPNKPHLSSKL